MLYTGIVTQSLGTEIELENLNEKFEHFLRLFCQKISLSIEIMQT